MASENPLISLGELSKPATIFIEKVSDAIGGIYRPYQIIRVATAEAKADLIKAQAQLEISELQRRAVHRFLGEEAQKQENIESITAQAVPELSENSEPEKLENDWLTNFFDKCKIISDAEMQQLWSFVLAGEANKPGSFSRRTVNMLASIDKGDALLFTQLCSFAWKVGELTPLIYDSQAEIYTKSNINFTTLKHLAYIGLIDFETLSGFKRMGFPQTIDITYFDTPLSLRLMGEKDFELDTGKVVFTKMGQELASVCQAAKNPQFFEFIKVKLAELGHTVINVHRVTE